MGDLRSNPERMAELIDHLDWAEAPIDYFYCDHRGLVTIGTGYLVDRVGAPDNVGRRQAESLARRFGIVRFVVAGNGTTATPAEVVADWQRVKDAGRRLGAVRAGNYREVARLRLAGSSIRALLRERLDRFLDDLYARRPAIKHLDERVAMAIVDARFNPAGVVLYGTNPRVEAMWDALDSGGVEYDPKKAVDLFENIWRGRGRERYQHRHAIRVEWMREGLAASRIERWSAFQ